MIVHCQCCEAHIKQNRLYKRSRKRERILELLRSTGRHPTADWLYEKLKDEFSNLSMGTVYRNLGILIDQGHVKKIDFGSTFDRFDANTQPHYHFVCESCGSVKDLELPIDSGLNRKAEKSTQHYIRRHRIEFYGECDKCRQKINRI